MEISTEVLWSTSVTQRVVAGVFMEYHFFHALSSSLPWLSSFIWWCSLGTCAICRSRCAIFASASLILRRNHGLWRCLISWSCACQTRQDVEAIVGPSFMDSVLCSLLSPSHSHPAASLHFLSVDCVTLHNFFVLTLNNFMFLKHPWQRSSLPANCFKT